MAAFTHVTVGTNDLAKARQFYDAVLAPLGLKRIKDFGDGGSCWGQSTEEFMVLKPADGKPATHANGGTISFEAPSRAAVAAFHKAALDLGATNVGAMRLVTLPLLWPAIIASGLLVFVMSFDDFVTSYFTTGVGVEPLPLRIYSMIHFGVTPEINAVGTLMMVMTIAIVLVALALFTHRQNARQELAAFAE